MGKSHTTPRSTSAKPTTPKSEKAISTTLKLEKMLHQGLCLGRMEDGNIALVSGGIPEETVRAHLHKRAGVLQGKVVEVLESSPHRKPTPVHSGLDYGHIAYDHQRTLKQSVIVDAYTRACQQQRLAYDETMMQTLPAVIASPQPWHYRYTVQPAVMNQQLGYRVAQSHHVQTLESDPTAHDSINRIWQHLHAQNMPKGIEEIVLRCNNANEVLIALIARASARNYVGFAKKLVEEGGLESSPSPNPTSPSSNPSRIVGVSYANYDPRGRFRSGSEKLAGKRSITQRYGDFRISTTTSSFAQPNPQAASLLYRHIQRWAAEIVAKNAHVTHALDLYAGSGIIAMHLLKHIPHVSALEIDSGAVRRAQHDAKEQKIDLTVIQGNAKKLSHLPTSQLICVDPPRAGLAKSTRDAIITSQAKHLIYVSCDVATWARDVVDLQRQGFQLEKIQGYDFYPHTHHIEILSLLSRD